MIKRIISLGISVICLFSVTTTVLAETSQETIFDKANFLTEKEEGKLSKQLNKLSEKQNMDFVIVTIDDAEGKTSRAYADDFYDDNNFAKSGALLLIDMDNREAYLSTSGKAEERFSDKDIKSITADVASHLGDGDYFKACNAFVDYGTVSLLQLLLFLGIALLVAFLVCLFVKAKYQLKFNQYHYPIKERASMQLKRNENIFLHENTTSRKIESSSSGEGSSTHTSSSGKSHGGGGTSF